MQYAICLYKTEETLTLGHCAWWYFFINEQKHNNV